MDSAKSTNVRYNNLASPNVAALPDTIENKLNSTRSAAKSEADEQRATFIAELDKADENFSKMPLWQKIGWGVFYTILSLGSLYFFMVAVKWIGDSFTLILGCETRSAFQFSDNPVAGLMVGTIATALLHSSGTVTSITVALVGAKGLTVRQAVPIIMGANVGTCVTCIMVAFGQVKNREMFQRAMAAATVHDMYNIWSVIVMFPIELIFHPLEKLSSYIADSGASTSSGAFKSPVDVIVNPLAQELIVVDKSMIEKVSTGNKTCEEARFLKGGAFYAKDRDDMSLSESAAGGICLAIGFVLLVCSLLCLVHMLAKAVRGPTQRLVRKMLNFNGYLNILVGTGVTFAVHSSTVVTSTLTPMAGLGLVTLEKVYPIVIGANLGTTATALLASLVTGKADGVAIALVHFFFNLFGIFLFYPIPVTRKPILNWARKLAFYSARWPVAAVIFILLLFLIVPGIALGLVYLYKGNTIALVFGIILTIAVALTLAGFYYWYLRRGGRDMWYDFLRRQEEKHQLHSDLDADTRADPQEQAAGTPSKIDQFA